MKSPLVARAIVFGLISSVALLADAQVPPLINYQGRVAVNGTNFDGAGQFKFALVNAAGTETFWSNDGASVAGSEPLAGVTLTVTKGLYAVLLGDTALGNMSALPPSVFTHPDVRLRVWFNDGTNDWQLLSPDQRLAPTAYLADGTVTSAALATSAVTSAHLAPGAVNGTHIASGSLDFSRLSVPAPPGAGQVLGFDGQSLVWQSPGSGSGGPWSLNGGSVYYQGGNVGIGTANPAAALEVISPNGNTLLYATAPVPNLLFRDTSSSATSVVGASGGGLRFYTNSFWTGASANAFMALDAQGRLGLGSFSPNHRLSIAGGPGWTSNFWKGALELENASAIAWQSNSGGQRFGLGHTDGSFVMFRTASDPGTTTSPPIYDLSITDAGRVGIGTTAPGSQLEVRTPSGQKGITHSDGVRSVGTYLGADAWFGTLSNHPLHLFVADGPSSLTIDASRRVGIGTTFPNHHLSILDYPGGPRWTSSSWVGAVELSNGSAIAWQPDAAGKCFGIGQTNGGFYLIRTNSTPGATGAPASYDLFVSDDGQVGIGTTSPSSNFFNGKLDVAGGARVQGKLLALQDIDVRAGSTLPLRVSNANNDTMMSMYVFPGDERLLVNGDAQKSRGGASWGVLSDARLKQDIRAYEPGLAEIVQLRPVRFRYREGAKPGLTSADEEVGFIAQEVQPIIPEAVTEEPDGYIALNADPIHWSSVNAIKELNEKLEEQRAENAELKRRLERLEAQLDGRGGR
jgi:hypothetical protein